MKIIRDEEFGGVMMIPLFCDWKINRCNMRDCVNKPTTIITGAHEKVPAFGLCENHYQQGIKEGTMKMDLVFI